MFLKISNLCWGCTTHIHQPPWSRDRAVTVTGVCNLWKGAFNNYNSRQCCCEAMLEGCQLKKKGSTSRLTYTCDICTVIQKIYCRLNEFKRNYIKVTAELISKRCEEEYLIVTSAVPIRNAVSTNIKHCRYFYSIKHPISCQSNTVVKGCMCMCLMW